MKNQIRGKKGITLIALVITIIVLLILAGVTIATLTGDNGLLQKATSSKQASEKGEIEEQIKLAYNDWKVRKETGETVDLQNTVQTALDKMYDNVTISKQGKSIIINVKGNEFTLIDDGTIEEGQLACLDVADGNIDLYSNGYKQYTGNLQNINKNGSTQYTGKYIITGTTTENAVRVCDEGIYDITIKNLNIDVNSQNYIPAINANAKKNGCNVTITIEGYNYLQGGNNAPGLQFAGATPNVNGVTSGSMLTIQGKGNLETKGGSWGSGIGTGYGYGGGNVNNITINSGNITAIGSGHGVGIGSSLRSSVNNIIINGGNITTNGIGSSNYGDIADNIIINGGKLSVTSSALGATIGGGKLGSGKLEINGGEIIANSTIGKRCGQVIITGGKVKVAGRITCDENGIIKITGGNVFATRINNFNIAAYEEGTSNLVTYTPTDGTSNLYETLIKLQEVGENKKVTKLTTSDDINYGINDMYTLENGMLYLYLPSGSRTITIDVDGKTYSGTVATTETPMEVTLSEVN